MDMCPGGWPRYEAQWEECALSASTGTGRCRGGSKLQRGKSMHETQSWFAGVDWASQKHDVWLADASGKRLGKRTFEHSGEGLAQMCDWLIATSGGKPKTSMLRSRFRMAPSSRRFSIAGSRSTPSIRGSSTAFATASRLRAPRTTAGTWRNRGGPPPAWATLCEVQLKRGDPP